MTPNQTKRTIRTAAHDGLGFAAWVRGDRKPLVSGYEGTAGLGDIQTLSGVVVSSCSNGTWPAGYDRLRRDAFDAARANPALAWSNALYFLSCRAWPVQNRLPDLGSAGPDLLLIVTGGNAFDSAGATAVRRAFPGSALLAVRGGLTITEFAGNACVDRAVRRYLLTGAKPARAAGDGPDATCARAKLPKPLKSDVRAAR